MMEYARVNRTIDNLPVYEWTLDGERAIVLWTSHDGRARITRHGLVHDIDLEIIEHHDEEDENFYAYAPAGECFPDDPERCLMEYHDALRELANTYTYAKHTNGI